MIRQMRRKFIAAAMLAVLVVMALIMALINGLNAYRIDQRLEGQLSAISDNRGNFPLPEPANHPRTPRPFDSAEDAFTTRHFSVLLNGAGDALEINTDSIAAVDDVQAVALARAAFAKKNLVGYRGIYKYQIKETEDGFLITFLDASQMQTLQRQLLLISVIVGFLSCAGVFLLLLPLSRRVIRPIERSIALQKQFITDAGHELKTPLTIISANCEILALNQGESEWLLSIHKQVDRMRKLVNGMVSLSQMDEVRPAIERARFSLSDAVYDTAMSFHPAAEREGKRLTVRVSPGAQLLGEEASIRQLTSILLDNAIKYCDAGGEIAVELAAGKSPLLTVENTCGSVGALELGRLFDRFYRADPARTGGGSYGLGLSIARSIAEAHRAVLKAEAAGKGKIRLRVKF